MSNREFVKLEVVRYNERYGTAHLKSSLRSLDIYENFVSVRVVSKSQKSTGYAKCNPCDTPNAKIGLSIATFRALKRIDGRKP